jgi:hypothetical protein
MSGGGAKTEEGSLEIFQKEKPNDPIKFPG